MRAVFVLALLPLAATADVIGPGAFGLGAIVESFENLSAGPNIPASVPFPADLVPGVSSPYTFASGATLVEPVPNTNDTLALFVHRSGLWGLAGHGNINALDIPDGTAFLGLDRSYGPVTFSFSTDMIRVGAFVDASPAAGDSVTMTFYDAQGMLIGSTQVAAVNHDLWKTNFIGYEAAGIRKVSFEGAYLALDMLTFEAAPAVPEPATFGMIGAGVAALGLRARRRVIESRTNSR
ncbi:MAG: PEP-CTERM sorting domain-containing protein [Bryobacteraceae bacterium]